METGSSDSTSVSVKATHSRSPSKVSFREHKDEYIYERRYYLDSASDEDSRRSSSRSSDISSDTHRRRRNHDTRSRPDSKPDSRSRSHRKLQSAEQRPRPKPSSPGTHHCSSSSTTFLPPARPDYNGSVNVLRSGPPVPSHPQHNAHPALPPQQTAVPHCAGHSFHQPSLHIRPTQPSAPGNLALLPPPGHNLPAPNSRRPTSPSPTATPTKTYTSPAGARDPAPTLLMSASPAPASGTAQGLSVSHAPGCPAAAEYTGYGATGCGCPPLAPAPPPISSNVLVAGAPGPANCCCSAVPPTNPPPPHHSYPAYVHHSACQNHPQQHYPQQHCQHQQQRNMAAHVHSGSAAVGLSQWTALDERMQALQLASCPAKATAGVFAYPAPAYQNPTVTPPGSGPWAPSAVTAAAEVCRAPPPSPSPPVATHGPPHFFPTPPPQQYPLPLSLPVAPPHLLPPGAGQPSPQHYPQHACQQHQQHLQQHASDHQGLTMLYDETTQEVVFADSVMTRELAKQGHTLTHVPEAYHSKLAALQALVNGGLAAKRQALLQQHAALAARAGEVAAARATLERQVAALAEDMAGRLRSAEGMKQALLGAEAGELAQQLGAIAELTTDIVAASTAGPADFLAAYRHLKDSCERLIARPYKCSVDVEATDLPAEAAVYGDLAASHTALNRLLGVKDTMIGHLLKEREALKVELRQVVERYTAELGALEEQCRDYHQRLMELGAGMDGAGEGEAASGECRAPLRTSLSPSAQRARAVRCEQVRPA